MTRMVFGLLVVVLLTTGVAWAAKDVLAYLVENTCPHCLRRLLADFCPTAGRWARRHSPMAMDLRAIPPEKCIIYARSKSKIGKRCGWYLCGAAALATCGGPGPTPVPASRWAWIRRSHRP